MGYTHYWTQSRDFSTAEFEEVTADVVAILADAEQRYEIAICDEAATPHTSPTVTPDALAFNGTDIGDQGHESFVLPRVRVLEPWQDRKHLGWDACKTERKPYDRAVTAALCYLATVVESHTVTSDGSGANFLAGLELARQALPRYANRLDIPRDVLETDRWCGPYIHVASRRYALRFCVDGRAYVLDRTGTSLFRFVSHFEAAQWLASHREPQAPEHRLFDPRGCIDQDRSARLERAQDRVLTALVASGGQAGEALGRHLQPPAFVRPGELPPIEAPLSLDGLLTMSRTAADAEAGAS